MIRLPARGRVLIKKPETEDRLPGGRIIIPEKSRESYAANQYQIISIGEPEECTYPEECNRLYHHFVTYKLCVHPIDPRVKAGAWIVCRPRSLVDAGEGLYLVRQDDVLAVFDLQLAPEEADRAEAERLTGGKEAIA